jgi:hypothetical protein
MGPFTASEKKATAEQPTESSTASRPNSKNQYKTPMLCRWLVGLTQPHSKSRGEMRARS